MRELTFRGFLKQYVRALSLSGTNGIYQLSAEAASNNPRLQEPLFLFALFTGREQVLLKATKSPELRGEFDGLLEKYDVQSMATALQDEDPSLPNNYLKVYRSYHSVKRQRHNDDHTKNLIRKRVLRLQQEKQTSTYRIYTDLAINSGNLHSFLKHGDCTKISLKTAHRVLEYMK